MNIHDIRENINPAVVRRDAEEKFYEQRIYTLSMKITVVLDISENCNFIFLQTKKQS
jgi:hypothetical protein